ncbi:long-chain-fatty-acid--CoA ligase [Rhizobium sp. VS19-DR104.2]|uniref:long-chain-fatty-acid--CoA ligase n=1 Tax=unclassified Rhizobium TaxID=2613769 RepID=UPI001C5B311C|nr:MULTISPECIES: long-chain-fatty-acid--CoA ligase [unclassified Rhizobium]MBZ5759897.1 long-chain-fatty-acid--CoA ligase [Rhizobium sp. VS19-DR96]MBZ5766285.1 long-chain-fatty-acid--CoA ligase [Rhizobium sp. VS19-DR129.2]MBZ5773068.1 long-chain-fatty-acid--CoA ligase [Rhizobium sp. VS19-DRK62.2]MBZ5784052.1 long-chain-fatty-acid--CoA ligase [Rhizobium sp. VS19-DR121]MBZ5803629.1 long-chain-fatty-acid--CoA ligase [Rhizobium sp. VS19-DR181]
MSEAPTYTGPAQDRIWLSSYPDCVPADLPPLEHQSLSELFEDSCARYATRPAFTSMGRAMTYGEMEQQTRKIAAWLQSRGFVKGDRVAVMMPNGLQNPVATFGILRAGLIVVNVNPLYTPRELEHQLRDCGAKAIFVLENFAHTVEQVLDRTALRHVVVSSFGEMIGLKGHIVNFIVRHVKKLVPSWSIPSHIAFSKVLAEGEGLKLERVALTQGDTAFLQYTGGTTGTAKAATLTHANLLANQLQLQLWLNSAYISKPRPEILTFVCALPLYHIFALTVNCLMGVSLGAHNVLIANPRDIPGFIKELGKHRVDIFPALNTLLNALMNNPDFGKLDLSQVSTLAGGMAVQRPIAERWHTLTGAWITEGYGLSETSPVASANRFDSTEFSGTIGLPLSSTDIDIRDDEGHSLPLGTVGEICIRGPQVMAGYWMQPEETARAMTPDGYFRSGDMGFMDTRGYTKIVDRKKDMILVSGFNVYPNEIEEVAAMHAGIVEAAAVGVADEHSGEAVKLFVVRRDPALTEADIKAHCARYLTNYKRPRFIEFRNELPKSNVGKILRKELRG